MPLVLAATPIGDPTDASPRLRAELATADVVAAEDTRRLRRLCAALEVEPAGRVVSHHEHNERERAEDLLEAMRGGARVLVVTDAGMPSVSDPGYRLVRAAVDADLPVTCVPGPSAVLAALAVSGLPTDRFTFEGFLPRKSGDRRRALEQLASEPRTMVFFEAPSRLAETLTAMAAAFGADRSAAVCRELTKLHEEVVRGGLAELAAWASGGVRGEIVVVVGGFQEDLRRGVADGVQKRVDRGQRRRVADDHVPGRPGLGQREIAAQDGRLDRVAGLRLLGPPRRHAVVQCELHVHGVVGRIGVDQRVAALVQFLAVGEPHSDPLRRMQGPVGEQATGLEAQPQVVRGDLGASGDREFVVARTQQLEHRTGEPARQLGVRHGLITPRCIS